MISFPILQVHDIEFAPSLDIILTQTLPELSIQVRDGKAKYIGITGYPVSILKECIEESNINISCILSYTRYTLIDHTLTEYIPFFKVRYRNDLMYTVFKLRMKRPIPICLESQYWYN